MIDFCETLRGRDGLALARQGEAVPGMASHTASLLGCGREAWFGQVRHREAGQVMAWLLTQRGSSPLQSGRVRLGFSGMGMSRLGCAGLFTLPPLGGSRMALRGTAGHGPARQGKSRLGKHTAPHGTQQFAGQGWARLGAASRGSARLGLANITPKQLGEAF